MMMLLLFFVPKRNIFLFLSQSISLEAAVTAISTVPRAAMLALAQAAEDPQDDEVLPVNSDYHQRLCFRWKAESSQVMKFQ